MKQELQPEQLNEDWNRCREETDRAHLVNDQRATLVLSVEIDAMAVSWSKKQSNGIGLNF